VANQAGPQGLRDPGRILVLGAGPTGLGAAHRLDALGFADFDVLEGRDGPGGLAASYVDDQGFTWDIGGHVQFSHYSYYDDVLDRAVSSGWLEHERESWIWIKGCWVPYPFQHNLHRLPQEDRDRALRELENVRRKPRPAEPGDFRQWIEQTFGKGIAEMFLFPYNQKVWGYPLETMGVDWVGQRVAVPDLERIRRSIRENRDDVSWGPNDRFRFPLRGGTGAIWKHVADQLPRSKLHFGSWVESVDLSARRVRLRGGRELAYDHLISTMPLDRLCSISTDVDGPTANAAAKLLHSSVHILGVGLRGDRPVALRRKCWMYFPEPHSPYYRVTVFSNYSPNNVPEGEDFWSLMAEVCESPHKHVDTGTLERWTIQALRRDRLIGDSSEVVSFWHHREEHGYPTPFLRRDEVLGTVLPWLEERGVFSRGRFGAWKYEVSNQDHSFMQGVELVNRLLRVGDEPTLNRPAYANSGVFLRGSEPG
jgi:protoporphyrinogen oxidase